MMFKKITNVIFMLTSFLLLSACAEMNSKFTCPLQPGVSCASLDEVNRRIDSGEIHSKTTATETMVPSLTSTTVAENELPMRSNEHVLEAWIAPFIDAQDNYHAEHTIYMPLQNSHWLAIHNKKEA